MIWTIAFAVAFGLSLYGFVNAVVSGIWDVVGAAWTPNTWPYIGVGAIVAVGVIASIWG